MDLLYSTKVEPKTSLFNLTFCLSYSFTAFHFPGPEDVPTSLSSTHDRSTSTPVLPHRSESVSSNPSFYQRSDSVSSNPTLHQRSDSITSTASENEFKGQFSLRRKCFIQRADSQQEYHRMSTQVYGEFFHC